MLFAKQIQNPIYKGILAVSDGFLVSSDIVGRSESAIVDLPLTQVVAGNMVKVLLGMIMSGGMQTG